MAVRTTINEEAMARKEIDPPHDTSLIPVRVTTDRKSAIGRAEAIISTIDRHLSGSIWSLYALGSVGEGGYVPGWSDIDLDVVVSMGQHGSSETSRLAEEITGEVNEDGSDEVDVKVFGLGLLKDRSRSIDYGLANRVVMLLDTALHIHGPDIRHELARPSDRELLEESRSIAGVLAAKDEEWWSTRPVDDLAALLALPARLCYTVDTGKVTSKQNAFSTFLSSPKAESFPGNAWLWANWAYLTRFTAETRVPPAATMDSLREAARDGLEWVARYLHDFTPEPAAHHDAPSRLTAVREDPAVADGELR